MTTEAVPVRRQGRRIVGVAPFLLYPLLALLSFPTLGHLLFGQHGIAYALDTFDLPRTGTGQDWLANGLTLWNTHLTAGNALFAQQSNTPFGIDVLLEPVIGPFAAYVVMSWLWATVAGIGMHLFLRDSMRLAPLAVVAGSVIYLFGFWHYIYGMAAPAIPLLFWLMDRAMEPSPRRWRYILGAILATVLVLYNGLSQVIIFAGAVQLAYVVVTTQDRAALPRRVALWAATWALAVAAYAPLVLTQLVMLPSSVRAYWDLAALNPVSLAESLRQVVAHYTAVAVGAPIGGLGASPGRYGTSFLGALGLPLLVLGIVGVRRDRRGWFLLALLLVIPAWDVIGTLGTPLLTRLGFLRSFQLDRLRHVLPFALAANAALGVDLLARTVLAGAPPPRLGRVRLTVLGVSVVPILAVLVVAVGEVVARRHDLRDLATPAVGWLLLAGALLLGVVALVAGGWALLRGRRARAGAVAGSLGIALVLVLVGERALYAWGERLTDEPAYRGTWAQTLAITPAKQFLLDQPGIGVDRVLSFGGSANQVAAAGMLQVDGYQSLYPETYHRLFGELIAPSLVDDPFHATYYGAWGNRAITFGPAVDPELVALVGARWLLVHDGSVPTVPGLVERFSDPSGTVYEVPDLVPRAFVAAGIEVAADTDALVKALGAADLASLRSTAYVTSAASADLPPGGAPPGVATTPAGSAAISEYTPDRVVVEVHADRPGVLVLTDVMAPGWVADVDGVRVPVATVDLAFRGVPVNAGTTQVVFRYQPGFTYAGFAIAVGALVLTAVLALAIRRRDRERGPVISPPGPGPS